MDALVGLKGGFAFFGSLWGGGRVRVVGVCHGFHFVFFNTQFLNFARVFRRFFETCSVGEGCGVTNSGDGF